jgi:hypothetical protein
MFRIEIAIVVALEDVAGLGTLHDPVEHGGAEFAAPVRHHLSRLVRLGRTDQREIAGVESRLHAGPSSDNHVREAC